MTLTIFKIMFVNITPGSTGPVLDNPSVPKVKTQKLEQILSATLTIYTGLL